MQVTLKEGTPQAILLQRGKVLSGTLKAVAKPTFRFDHPIKVVYAGEPGEDYGGPRREFLRIIFRLALREINSSVITSKTFPRTDTLLQVQESKNQSELTSVLNKDAEWYLDLGVFGNTVKFLEKERFLKTLITNELMYKVQSELTQFRDGMDSVGWLFVSDSYETAGGYEKDWETGLTLEHVLSFWTGASKKPPLGFDKRFEVNFINCDDEYLPVAKTCGMCWNLNVGRRMQKDLEKKWRRQCYRLKAFILLDRG
ncbi:uncharacterized protein LOC128555431 [Mercenaria mercenaria]|uniref:uncharacterized protein LOC128555431 n=1 Tax=Mercenaria mercenaria TaxID=6596 RepID=UPI00234ED735|nr:uncharacterized protein LOC128555431 [Mercenaria mercenaria]